MFLHWGPWTSSFLCLIHFSHVFKWLAHFLRFLLKRPLIHHVHLPKLSPSLTMQYKKLTLHLHLEHHVPFSLWLKLSSDFSLTQCGRIQNIYLIFMSSSWHWAPKPYGFSWEMGVPLSVRPECMLMRWVRWEPLDSLRMSLVQSFLQKGQVLRELELPAPPTDLQDGERCSWLKTLKIGLTSIQVGEHMDLLGEKLRSLDIPQLQPQDLALCSSLLFVYPTTYRICLF